MPNTLQTIILILAPVLLLGSTYLAFQMLTRCLGLKRGYLLGFIFYWGVWCVGLPLALVGPQGILAFFNSGPVLGQPAWLSALCLLIPLLLGYAYAFPRAIRNATWQIVLLSAALALVNATLEEVLWRGTYLAFFPANVWLGMVYPAIGFAVWHFAPQSVFPNKAPGGNVSLVVVAGVIGLMFAWAAGSAGTLVWVTLSHILFDFSGLGGRLYAQPALYNKRTARHSATWKSFQATDGE